MVRGGNENCVKHLTNLVDKLKAKDTWLNDAELDQILSHGRKAIPFLEENIRTVAERSSENGHSRLLVAKWRPAVQALYLLAHLKSEGSLDLILRIFGQESSSPQMIFPAFVRDDLWEAMYLLGANRLSTLEEFLLNDKMDELARLSAATALVQIALHQVDKYGKVVEIFEDLLQQNAHSPDFIGLLINELMDLRAESLRAPILNALTQHQVWDGFISEEEVLHCYSNAKTRQVTPPKLSERLKHYQQIRPFTNFKQTAARKPKSFDMPGIS